MAEGETVRLSPVQRQTAKFLSRSLAETAQVTIFGEIDVTAMIALRQRMKSDGAAPSVTHFIIAALARTLRRHPQFNAAFDGTSLTLQPQVDLGFAVSLSNGDLVSPVLHGVGRMGLAQIGQSARALAEKAQSGLLELADLKGAGFTFSSVGTTATAKFATPVVPIPQVAILAAMAIREQAVIRDGRVEIAPVLPVSLSFDHRALNGAAANDFLQTLADVLSEPETFESPVEGMGGET